MQYPSTEDKLDIQKGHKRQLDQYQNKQTKQCTGWQVGKYNQGEQ